MTLQSPAKYPNLAALAEHEHANMLRIRKLMCRCLAGIMFIMLSVLPEHLSMLIFVIETEYSSVQTRLTVLEVFGPKSKAWTQAEVDLKVALCEK